MTFFQGRRDRLDGFRAADRGVLGDVFRHYIDDVAMVLRMGFRVGNSRLPGIGDPDRERELTQEVFIRAFAERARMAFDGLSAYRPYLLQIARNLMIDQARAAGQNVDRVSDAELAAIPSLEPEAADVLERGQLTEATKAYCASLSSELRRFVTVRFEEGLSQRDAAEALGVTRRQIRTWEDQVREGLARQLRQLGFAE